MKRVQIFLSVNAAKWLIAEAISRRPEVQTAARKYIAVGFIHFVIAFVQPCRVLIKGVVILHNENT